MEALAGKGRDRDIEDALTGMSDFESQSDSELEAQQMIQLRDKKGKGRAEEVIVLSSDNEVQIPKSSRVLEHDIDDLLKSDDSLSDTGYFFTDLLAREARAEQEMMMAVAVSSNTSVPAPDTAPGTSAKRRASPTPPPTHASCRIPPGKRIKSEHFSASGSAGEPSRAATPVVPSYQPRRASAFKCTQYTTQDPWA